jgi:peptide/nickel transport system substrate-binding protein
VAPFDNKLVRQAVSWAMDRQAILDIAFQGTGERGVEEVPSRSVFYDGVDPFAEGPDLDRAKDLMTEAGYPDGGLSVEFIGVPDFPGLFKTGEIMQQQLLPLGIDVSITVLDESVWLDRFSKGEYQMLSAFRSRTIHPDTMYSGVILTDSPLNWTGYSNPEVDTLINAAVQEADPAKATPLYQEIRAKVAEDAPLLFTHYETVNWLMRKNVVGSEIVPTLALRFELVGFSE